MKIKTTYLLMTGDTILITCSFYIAHVLRFGFPEPFLKSTNGVLIVLYAVIVNFSSFFMELYNVELNNSYLLKFFRVTSAAVISFLILSALFYIVPEARIYRGWHLMTFMLFGIFQFLWHILLFKFLESNALTKKVVIVGTGHVAHTIGKLIENVNHHHKLAGYVQCSPRDIFVPPQHIISTKSDIAAIAKQHGADKIVVSLQERRGTLPINNILACKLKGIEVVDAPLFYEQLTNKLLLEAITPSWFIFAEGFRLTHFKLLIKNAMDKALAVFVGILCCPLLLVIALLIKVDSRGPVFYLQTRVGQKDALFKLIKFRTMRPDAENSSGAVWASKEDSRCTRFGRFLRKIRLDELPQIINILKGDMSFVGPRPERPEFVEKLKELIPYYSERHIVKPGITGWAQVKYAYGASVEDSFEKMRYDLYYMKHLSIGFDIFIMIETLKVVLFGKGGR